MTPSGVTETESRRWVNGMVNVYVYLAKMWRGSLDEALEEARRREPLPDPLPEEGAS